ncbi:MAG: hypothetical protein HY899_15470 [Deltaproteobacteria bacterium]|nr:hypothetical protein [Deltaproteobacteria bacterium]
MIAIMGIIGALAVPNLEQARKGANEAAAIADLEAIVAGQNGFSSIDADSDAIVDFATSLAELAAEADGGVHYIDDSLGSGLKSGYTFDMEGSSSPTCDCVVTDRDTCTWEMCPIGCCNRDGVIYYLWKAEAKPTSLFYTGDRYFYVDQTGIVRSSDHRATADDPPVAGPRRTLTLAGPQPDRIAKVAIVAIKKLNRLGAASAIADAQAIVSDPANVALILAELDRDGDGNLSWAEVVGTDYLARARTLKRRLSGLPPEGAAVGDDAALLKVSAYYRKQLRKTAKLGCAEAPLPGVPTVGLPGDPVALIGLTR